MGAVRQRILALAVAGACVMARADRVYLKNGRHLDGLIETESRKQITLRVEGGRMTVARHRIKNITYSRPADARQIEQTWKQKYFLNAAYVPSSMNDIASRVRRLQDERNAVGSARKSLERFSDTEHALQHEREVLATALSAAGEQLRGISSSQDVEGYNRCVTQIHDLQHKLMMKTDALQALPKQRQTWREQISNYMKAVESVRVESARLQAGGGECSTEEQIFLNRLLGEVNRMASEFHTTSIPLDDERFGHTVAVRINEGQAGRFVVDTGAAIVTLSRAYAERIGLTWNEGDNPVSLVLANGETEIGQGVMLDSVSIGDIESRDVPAVVIKTAPGEGVDGLLGMSFLERFHLHMDSGNHHMSITEFAPEE